MVSKNGNPNETRKTLRPDCEENQNLLESNGSDTISFLGTFHSFSDSFNFNV